MAFEGLATVVHVRVDDGYQAHAAGWRRGQAGAMLRTLQQHFSKDVSIGLLRDRIGRQPWMLAAAMPCTRLCVCPGCLPSFSRNLRCLTTVN
ncbi:MAG: hypothetical protein OXC13_00265 [Caldilineaceae bacterium]|nr:hypothetical protein [Caldilineaceae bacterium]